MEYKQRCCPISGAVSPVWSTLFCFSFCVWNVAVWATWADCFLVECLPGLKMKWSVELLSLTPNLFSFCFIWPTSLLPTRFHLSLPLPLCWLVGVVLHLPVWTTSLLSSRLKLLWTFGLLLFLSLSGHVEDGEDLKLLWFLRKRKLSFHTKIEKKEKTCSWPIWILLLWAKPQIWITYKDGSETPWNEKHLPYFILIPFFLCIYHTGIQLEIMPPLLGCRHGDHVYFTGILIVTTPPLLGYRWRPSPVTEIQKPHPLHWDTFIDHGPFVGLQTETTPPSLGYRHGGHALYWDTARGHGPFVGLQTETTPPSLGYRLEYPADCQDDLRSSWLVNKPSWF